MKDHDPAPASFPSDQPDVADVEGSPYCFGHQAALDLLVVAREILAKRDNHRLEFVQMARQSVEIALRQLCRCEECRTGYIAAEAVNDTATPRHTI